VDVNLEGKAGALADAFDQAIDGIGGEGRAAALCRALVAAGQDPNRPLHAYRGDVLCLRLRSIGEGARLTVEDDQHGRPRLRRWRNRARRYGAGPLARQIRDHRPPCVNAHGCER
jgi:hypothetical protein